MKLSTNAKQCVTDMVREAFGAELKAACDKKDAIESVKRAKWEAFEKELVKIEKDADRKIASIIGRMGLTVRDGYCANYSHVRIEREMHKFNETFLYDDKEWEKANRETSEVEDKIRKAVSKALFEIEVHGSKGTLDEIVEKVVSEAKSK